MDLLANLNEQQRVAVQHGRGPALVLAGAGSGKTRVITYRIAYLVANQACRPENILAVTFTNKAAREMRERLHVLLGSSRPSEPLVSTFHSFCVRLLRREISRLGYSRDFSIYDTDDQRKLMKQILEARGEADQDIAPREILRRISYAKNHSVPAARYAERFAGPDAEWIAELYEIYEARLRKASALDFDDLLLKAVRLLEEHPAQRDGYSNTYRYILVDEYQDTNRPQYELLRLLTAKHNNLFVVGDEDQSIYRFRGADIQNILRFEKDFAGASVIRLEQNYRSTQNILKVASTVVAHNTERKGKTLWTENPSGDTITCRRSRSARYEAEWACRRITGLLEEEPAWRIAVLYRANFLSRNFEEVLVQSGIPYAVVGSVAFFGRMEVKDMLGYLRVIYNPEDDVALLRVINTPPRGIGATAVDLIAQTAIDSQIPLTEALRRLAADPARAGRAARALQRFLGLFDGWCAMRDTASPSELLESVLEKTDYRKMLEKAESAAEAEDRLANIEELLRAAAESSDRGETVFEFLDRAALSSELDALDPNARVALMTLHSAKGLEFDAVFLAGLEEGLFPHSLSSGSREEIEEERRLCYVGVTRARRKLYLLWTPFRRSFGPEASVASLPSRFLEEMPAELVEGLEDSLAQPTSAERRHGSFWIEDEEEDFGDEEDELEEEEDSAVAAAGPRRRAQEPEPKTLAELREYVASRQATPGPAAGLKAGARVRHAQFGDGIVVSRQRSGNDFKLVVHFSRVGRKTLVERFAKLQPL